MGISEKLHFTKKYLLKGKFNPFIIPDSINHETFKETIYFIPTGDEERISWVKIRQYDTGRKGYFYYHRKLAEKEEERIELIRNIDLQNYDMYYRQRDKTRKPVEKEITVFVWKNRSCLVENFWEKTSQEVVSVLRVTSDEKEQCVNELPEFLEIDQDISEDPKYFTKNL